MKKKLILSFPQALTGEPLTYNLIKKYDVKINILRAHVDYNVKGTLLVDVEAEEGNLSAGIQYLTDSGVEVKTLEALITIDEDCCINCGACTAVCIVDALQMDEQWNLLFQADKCLDCKLCLKACPARAISSVL